MRRSVIPDVPEVMTRRTVFSVLETDWASTSVWVAPSGNGRKQCTCTTSHPKIIHHC